VEYGERKIWGREKINKEKKQENDEIQKNK